MSKAKEILSQLQAYYHKIENEQFSPNDLEEMVRLSRELYERSVILRYKSFEQKVFDSNKVAQTIATIVEPKMENQNPVEEIDFSIFEEEKAEDQVHESPMVEKKTVLEETPAFDFSSPEQPEMEALEEVEEEEMAAEPEPWIDSRENEEIEEEVAEEPVMVEEEVVIPQKSMDNSGNSRWVSFFGKIAQEKNSGFISSINSLSGSFGLNERLLYINELFNSDSDTFTEGIKKLENCAEWSTCMQEMDGLAEQLNWDQENETVAEFVGHVYRKYA